MYIGWHGKGNVGDDAAFLGLKKLRPDVIWLPMLEGRKHHIAKRFGLDEIQLAKGAVLGGGTTISTEYYRRNVSRAIEIGMPVWCCGSGVGSTGWEQESEPDLSRWFETLKQFQGIGVRGPLSFQKLKHLGIQKIAIVGDLALPLVLDSLPDYDLLPTLAVNVSVPVTDDKSNDKFK